MLSSISRDAASHSVHRRRVSRCEGGVDGDRGSQPFPSSQQTLLTQVFPHMRCLREDTVGRRSGAECL